jgi:hypothetical protein
MSIGGKMLPAIFITVIISFFIGWFSKDYKWINAANKGKVMVVNGDLYDVRRHTESHEGSVEK